MFTRFTFAMLLLLCAAGVSAQEVRLDVLADGVLVFGVVSHADGSPAGNLPVGIALGATPQTQVASVQTDAVGIFSWTGTAQTSYAVSAGGVSVTVTTGEAPPQPFQWPPIYITLGALLMLSLIPARLLRRPELR
jgi:hypothetical protein